MPADTNGCLRRIKAVAGRRLELARRLLSVSNHQTASVVTQALDSARTHLTDQSLDVLELLLGAGQAAHNLIVRDEPLNDRQPQPMRRDPVEQGLKIAILKAWARAHDIRGAALRCEPQVGVAQLRQKQSWAAEHFVPAPRQGPRYITVL